MPSLSLRERLGSHETEMLHRFEYVQNAKSADRRFCGIFEIEKILERKLFEARSGEGGEFGAAKGPGHLAFGVAGFATAGEKESGGTKCCHLVNALLGPF